MKTTKHAEIRLKQRGIPRLMPELLGIYGIEVYQKGGTFQLQMSGKCQKRLVKDLKQALRAIQNSKSYFSIIDEKDVVITAGHFFSRS